jgi:polyferredoxin
MGKNEVRINPFYMTDHGISIASIYNYVIYYGVIFLLLIPALIHGRRAACHYTCWMAPFMVIGSSIGRLLQLPQLHIEADKDKCISCGKCSRVCPMGLDVKELVKNGRNSKCTECIQCGACIDECPKSVLKYRFTWK